MVNFFEDWFKDIIYKIHLYTKMLPFLLLVQVMEKNSSWRSEKVTLRLKRNIRYYRFSALLLLHTYLQGCMRETSRHTFCQYPRQRALGNNPVCWQAHFPTLSNWLGDSWTLIYVSRVFADVFRKTSCQWVSLVWYCTYVSSCIKTWSRIFKKYGKIYMMGRLPKDI